METKSRTEKKITKSLDSPFYTQLFFDIGNGFSEKDSISKAVFGIEKSIEFDVSNVSDIKALRFDPINIRCVIHIRRVRINYTDNSFEDLDYDGNFLWTSETLSWFDTDDPNIHIEFTPSTKRIKSVAVELDFMGIGQSALNLLQLQLNKIKELEKKVAESNEKLAERSEVDHEQEFFSLESVRLDYVQAIQRANKKWEDLLEVKNGIDQKYQTQLANNIGLKNENRLFAQDIKVKKEELQYLQSQIATVNNDLSALRALIAEKDQIKADIEKAAALHLTEKNNLEIKLANAQLEKEKLLEDYDSLKKDNKRSQDQILDLDTVKSSLIKENQGLKKTLSENANKLQDLETNRTQLENEIQSKVLHIDNIQKEINQKNQHIQALEQHSGEQQQKFEELSQWTGQQYASLERHKDILHAIKASLSYRLGMGITAPARWMYEAVKTRPKQLPAVELEPAAIAPVVSEPAPEMPAQEGAVQEDKSSLEATQSPEPVTDQAAQEVTEISGLEKQILDDKNLDPVVSKRYSLLFICPHLPDYDTSSGGKRATRMLQMLAEEYDVYVYTLGDRPQKYIDKLEEIDVKVLDSPLFDDIDCDTHNYAEVKEQVEHLDAIVFAWYTTYYQSKKISELYPRANVIFDSVDVHWIREERLLKIDESFSAEGVAINKRNEIDAYRKGNIIWAVTQEDKEHILDEIPNADVRIVSNVHELEITKPVERTSKKILFLGGYKHTPNLTAVDALVTEIFPQIRAKHPDATLVLAGSHAPPEIRAYGELDGVDFRGFIEEEDLEALYEECHLTLIPLLAGAGIKGKICEAIAYKLPIITNDIGNEGINLEHGKDALVCNEFDALAQCAIDVFDGKYDLNSMTVGAQHKMTELVGAEVVKKAMVDSVSPCVSICIVTWNRQSLLERCVQSVLENTEYPNYKILVWSNGCADGTKEYLTALAEKEPRVEPILSDKNEVFVIPNNEMMLMYPDNDVVLVNNDTYVTRGWLRELHESAYARKNVGISGSKILYPDGRLQELGSELYANYSGNNIGKFDDPNKEQFLKEKEVGYVSGCSMYITRKTLDRIGVFDMQFHPCYCEDSDLAYTAWEHGIASVANPKSIIYHDEGGTSGTDTTNGFKAFQDINFHKFYTKHQGKINRINWDIDKIDLGQFDDAIKTKFFDQAGRVLINGTQKEHAYSIKFQTNTVQNYREYKRYFYSMEPVYNKRFILERRLSELFSHSFEIVGWDPITDQLDNFVIGEGRDVMMRGFHLPNYRDSMYNAESRSNSRIRALYMTMYNTTNGFEGLKDAYVTDNITGINKALERFGMNVTHGFDETFFGTRQKNNKQLSKLLCETGLADNSQDIIVHNELMHFSPDYKAVIAEMYRVLKKEAYAFVSIPFLVNQKYTDVRATIDEDGDIEHIKDPLYFNNNLLCHQLFAWDVLEEMRSAGFSEVFGSFSWSLYYGVLGTDILTLVLKK